MFHSFVFLQVMLLTDNIQLILNAVQSSTVVEVQVFSRISQKLLFLLLVWWTWLVI